MEAIDGDYVQCAFVRKFTGIGGVLVEEFRVSGRGRMRRFTKGKEQWWAPAPPEHARDFIGPAQVRKMIAEQEKERGKLEEGT